MAVKGLTLTKSDVSQTINLEDVLGVSFVGEKALRLSIAQAVIDYIVERTQDGKALNGGSFKPYSKDYKESTAFNLLKDSSEVNMTLTGSMLGSIDVLSDGPNTIRIGFRDTKEKLKAFNHNTGDTLPKRPFFGVTQKEVKELIEDQFSSELNKLRSGETDSEAKLTVREILSAGAVVNQNESTTGSLIFFTNIGEILGR